MKTVSPQSGGAIRDNYKTVLYVGGDKTTANVLLDGPVDPSIEPTLGKGPVMLRCETVKKAALAHTAFTDNPSLYLLLGPSTYQPVQDDDPLADGYHEEPDFGDDLDDDEKSDARNGNGTQSQKSLKTTDEGRRNGNGNGVTAVAEPASEEAGSQQNGAYVPPGWENEKIHQLIGAFRVSRHLDNSLQALGLSTSQRNRDFAREVLKRQGLWK